MAEKNWIDEMFEHEWFLIERTAKVIREAGYPEVYYEAYISTSPYDDKARGGYRLANIQRWFGGGPDYKGYIEARVGHHLVEAHNAMLKAKQLPVTETVNVVPAHALLADETPVFGAEPPKKERKKREFTPEQKEKMIQNMWPKGLPRLKHPDGRAMKKIEVQEFLANEEAKKAEAAGNGAIPQGQPVQTETPAAPQEIQPEAQTQERSGPMTTSSVYGVPEENVIPEQQQSEPSSNEPRQINTSSGLYTR